MYRIIALAALLFVGCQNSTTDNDRINVVATIPPIQFLVDRIADTTVNTFTLLGETTSPETFDITPAGMKHIANSDLIFSIGLIDFENSIEQKLMSSAPKSLYVKLSDETTSIAGTCSHGDHSHAHGVDPHVWLSLANMKIITEKVAAILIEKLPENKKLYIKNRDNLINEIVSINAKADSALKNVNSFAIVHPSLSYFARDYNLTQVAIEQDGKEPSAAALKILIDELKTKNCETIFYSRQNPVTVANHIANEIGAKTVEYDPVQYQWMDGMKSIIETLTEKK